MLGRLFGRKEPPKNIFVTDRLNARLRPMDRGSLYEDPLHDTLEAKGLGEVTGGGTEMGADGEVRFCDIDLEVGDTGENTLSVICDRLESLGAPKGSHLTVGPERREIAFGTNEGLAVYLNGTDLPASVYEEYDGNEVIAGLSAKLGPKDRYQSYWNGPRDTAL